jgi:hypothetical protein
LFNTRGGREVLLSKENYPRYPTRNHRPNPHLPQARRSSLLHLNLQLLLFPIPGLPQRQEPPRASSYRRPIPGLGEQFQGQ